MQDTAEYGDAEAIGQLRDADPRRVYSPDEHGAVPLHYAVAYISDEEAVVLLLNQLTENVAVLLEHSGELYARDALGQMPINREPVDAQR